MTRITIAISGIATTENIYIVVSDEVVAMLSKRPRAPLPFLGAGNDNDLRLMEKSESRLLDKIAQDRENIWYGHFGPSLDISMTWVLVFWRRPIDRPWD